MSEPVATHRRSVSHKPLVSVPALESLRPSGDKVVASATKALPTLPDPRQHDLPRVEVSTEVDLPVGVASAGCGVLTAVGMDTPRSLCPLG
ncbi:hypothetical protein JYK22_21725, partial [Nonomuraea sp. RK-328]|nr:hypothetical protein [Nonomuraea sp. RK-328]